MELNIKKTNSPIKKWAEDLNRHLSKEDIHTDGQKAHEKMLNIANYYRNTNQSYNEVSPHTSQHGHQKKSTDNKCWRGCGEKGTYTVGGNVNWYSHYGEQYGGSLEK